MWEQHYKKHHEGKFPWYSKVVMVAACGTLLKMEHPPILFFIFFFFFSPMGTFSFSTIAIFSNKLLNFATVHTGQTIWIMLLPILTAEPLALEWGPAGEVSYWGRRCRSCWVHWGNRSSRDHIRGTRRLDTILGFLKEQGTWGNQRKTLIRSKNHSIHTADFYDLLFLRSFAYFRLKHTPPKHTHCATAPHLSLFFHLSHWVKPHHSWSLNGFNMTPKELRYHQNHPKNPFKILDCKALLMQADGEKVGHITSFLFVCFFY